MTYMYQYLTVEMVHSAKNNDGFVDQKMFNLKSLENIALTLFSLPTQACRC